MKKTAIAILGALLIAVSGCATTEGKGGNEQAAAAAAAIKAAEAALDKAKSVDGAWRDVPSFIKKAKAAASKADYETAIKLANKAKFQGDMGYQQAMGQKDAGPWLF